MSSSLPTEIGGWTLLSPMGKGAMGQVWKVHRRTVTGASVLAVMKLPLAGGVADADAGHRWLSEATLLMKAQTCGHVVRVFDLGVDRGVYYLVMDYVHGTDLGRLLRLVRHAHRAREPRAYLPLEIPTAVWIGAQLMLALSEIHGLTIAGLPQGIIHKDVAPKNILLSVDGEVKLGDFGIATARDVELTNAGTLRYMAPEHHAGFASQASDVYAGAVTLWETIELVQYRSSDADACRREMFAPPRPLSRPGVPQAIADVLAAGLAPRAEDRPTAGEFVDAIERSGCYVPGERAVGRLVKHYVVGAATSGQTQTFQAADQLQRTSSLDGLLLERERKAARESLDTARMIERARARGRRGGDDEQPVPWPALEAAIARQRPTPAAGADAPPPAADGPAAPDARSRPTAAETDAPMRRGGEADDTMLEPPPRPRTAVVPPELLGVPRTEHVPPAVLPPRPAAQPVPPMPSVVPSVVPSMASVVPPMASVVPPMPPVAIADPAAAPSPPRPAHERPITLSDPWPASAQSSTLEGGPTARTKQKRRFAIGVVIAAGTAIVLGTAGGLIAADLIARSKSAAAGPGAAGAGAAHTSAATPAPAHAVAVDASEPAGPRLVPVASGDADARRGAVAHEPAGTTPSAAATSGEAGAGMVPARDPGSSDDASRSATPTPTPRPTPTTVAPSSAAAPSTPSSPSSSPAPAAAASVAKPTPRKLAVAVFLDFIDGADLRVDGQRFTIVRDQEVRIAAGKHRVRWREHGSPTWHDAGRLDFDTAHRHVLRFGAVGKRGYLHDRLPPAAAGGTP